MIRLYLHIILLFLFLSAKSQYFVPLNDFHINAFNNRETGSVYPLVIKGNLYSKDSLINYSLYKNFPENNKWLVRKIFYEHFVRIRDKSFEANISPLAIFELGKEDNSNRKIYRNSRGIYLEATMGESLGFYSTFFENQSKFMSYIEDYAEFYGVVPQQGFHKPIRKTDYDYAWSEGMILFMPSKKWNLQFGHGKRFIGNGYRSMLYSDNSFSYPQFFVNYIGQKFKYFSWFTSFMNPDFPDINAHGNHLKLNDHWQRKAGVFHYLTYNPADNIQMALFEGSILQSRNNKGDYSFNIEHYNPLIIINSLNKKNNSYLGLNLNCIIQDFMFYGQCLVNSENSAKNGFQVGLIYSKDLSNIHFNILNEVNHASKGLYSFSDSVLSYSHYNQPLAHPLGENFTEMVSKTEIRIKSFELAFKINLTYSKSDSAGIPAINLFLPDRESVALDQSSQRLIKEVKISYIINPQTNARITAGAIIRNFDFLSLSDKTSFYYLSFSTDIFRRYYDF